jgi:hypothetical protein
MGGLKHRRKSRKMKSILPDHLEAIEEVTEHSEEASVSSLLNSPVKSPQKLTETDFIPAVIPINTLHEEEKKESGRSRRSIEISHDDEQEKNGSGRGRRSTKISQDEDQRKRENSEHERSDNHGRERKKGQDDSEETSLRNCSKETAKMSESDGSNHSLDSQMREKNARKRNDSTFQDPGAPQRENELMFDYDDEFDENDDTAGESQHSRRSDGVDEDALTWRLDPSESLSDWTIKVTIKGSGRVESYHVHKNILAVGKRKSEYFAKIFKTQNHQYGEGSNTTEIAFAETAARMVPVVLDWIYSDQSAIEFSTETVLGLRYLSQFFGIHPLFEKAMKFIRKDLSLKTIIPYYKGSTDLGDKKIRLIVARHCARNVNLIPTFHELIRVMDPQFFFLVISSQCIEGHDKTLHVSKLLAEYFRLHKDKLDEESFSMLTKEDYLPEIHHTAALTMLEMEADLVVATSVLSFASMTNLQERCVKVLAAHWRELSESDPERTKAICRKLPSFVLAELLIKSMQNAKDGSTPSGRAVKRASFSRKRTTKTSEANDEDDDMVSKLKEEYDSSVANLREQCAEKDKRINTYLDELKRFERLPNAPNGKLTTSGRLYRPSKMPEIVNHSKDGYLLKTDGLKLPVFYYKGE